MRRFPLDALAYEPMASGHRSLRLTRAVSWEAFPRYANAVLRALDGTVVEKVDSPVERVWCVVIGGNDYWLAFDDFGLGVDLSPRNDQANAALEGVRLKLLEAAAGARRTARPRTAP